MRNLDVTTLRSFVAVAEQGGVTRAAAALNLTQSAVSMQLKRLEELLGQDLSKAQQSSDWGGPDLSDAQKEYAASDVRYLHRLRAELERRLAREGRTAIAQACFDFLPSRAALDLAGWPEQDIFAHA